MTNFYFVHNGCRKAYGMQTFEVRTRMSDMQEELHSGQCKGQRGCERPYLKWDSILRIETFVSLNNIEDVWNTIIGLCKQSGESAIAPAAPAVATDRPKLRCTMFPWQLLHQTTS
jgi:hypothetical protein